MSSKKLPCVIMMLSLALNVVLGGYIIGRESMAPPRQDRAARFEEAMKDLPPEKQAHMRELMGDFRASMKEDFEQVRAKRDELRDILTAETFNPNAFRAKAKELNAMYAASKKTMIENMVRMAKDMPQEDRKILADAMHRPPMGPPQPAQEKGPASKE